MDIAITVGTVVKKALELLAVNDSGRKFLGYVLCIAVFLLLLPVIVVCGLFGWMANDGGTLLLREELLNNLPEENTRRDRADEYGLRYDPERVRDQRIVRIR